ncbi:MAG TPA: class I SAM-dependent methyltransferase [Bacteroidia bacterium]|nr:class I SAM-dependent methyltransferase [Bacteroidia bacterium]
MDHSQKKVEDSAKFYNRSMLNFDLMLAEYGYKTIKPYFRGDTGMEIGPSTGYVTRFLKDDFRQLDLVEGSGDLLAQIPQYPNVRKFHSMVEQFEPDTRYQTIVMSHILEHIEHPVEALKRIKEWLAPDGLLIISVPNANSIHRMAAVEMGLLGSVHELNARDLDLGHYRVYDPTSLKNDIRMAGLETTHNGGYFFKPLSNGQIETNWTLEMIEGFYKLGKLFPEHCAEIYCVCKSAS